MVTGMSIKFLTKCGWCQEILGCLTESKRTCKNCRGDNCIKEDKDIIVSHGLCFSCSLKLDKELEERK